MNSDVDKFLKNAKQWQDEMTKLRDILLKSGLDEELKWNLPCYTYNGRNIVITQPFKKCLGLMFFKGGLLKDPKKVLVDNGPNSNATRRFEFRSTQDISKLSATIKSYVKEAIAIEKSGKKVEAKKVPLKLPVELTKTFAKNARLKKAFEALTPGRQRGYILHISSAKQSATRETRIKKCAPLILQGKGFNER